MPRIRDPMLLLAAGLLVVVTVLATAASIGWIGKPFAGFLLLENRVVASAGLHRWPAARGGEIYQHEVVRVDGEELRDARDLARHVRSLPVGTPVTYELRSGGSERLRTIAIRRFDSTDWLLLFGSYLFLGLGLCGVALAIRFLRGPDRVATGSALSLGIVGLMAITATDLYGPYHLFRLHAWLECFMFAGTLHFMLVFPEPTRILERRPWLVWVPYAVATSLATANQIGLFHPPTYTVTHRMAVAAFAASLLAFIASQVWAWVRPRSFAARQRVKIAAIGTVAALSPPVVLFLHSAISGGQAPENTTAFTAILYPISIGYAVLRTDLLRVDVFLRRSLNYALLTALVMLTAVGVLTAADAAIREFDLATSRFASILVLASVAAVVVLPLRERLQSVVDRTFFRSAYDFRRHVEAISERLASVTDLAVICHEIEGAVGEALQPEWIHLAVRRLDEPALELSRLALLPVQDLPRDALHALERPGDVAVVELEGGGLAVPFVLEERLVAMLFLARRRSGGFYGADDRHLLHVLANQGAVAMENALAVEELHELNRSLEARVEDRTSELASALTELRETQRQMVHQEKMASVGQLVAGVAHEINNPLNFIAGNLYHLRGYAEALAKALGELERAAGADPELVAAAKRIREENDIEYAVEDLASTFAGCDEGVERATRIVRDLRTFSRLDSGEAAAIDLEQSLDATLNLLRGRLTGIRVVREFGGIGEVECLEGQLQQVFMNLLSNAADALGEEGTIYVRTRRMAGPSVEADEHGQRVEVEVEDDGCGIDPEHADRIFEPFFTTKEVGRGTGLGLAISYGIVARHGGQIEVRSRPREGTCFRVELPVRFRRPPDGAADRGGSSP